jgi:hypothetical protein
MLRLKDWGAACRSSSCRRPTSWIGLSASLVADARRRSATSALQDWLNADGGTAWGLCCNGAILRLVRANASLTRPAHVEADLRRIFEDEAFADFAALWLLVHASRFGQAGAQPADCALEYWRQAGQKEGRRAVEELSGSVEAALLSLGNGFLSHPDNSGGRARARSGELPLPEFFGQLLPRQLRSPSCLPRPPRTKAHGPCCGMTSMSRNSCYASHPAGIIKDLTRTACGRTLRVHGPTPAHGRTARPKAAAGRPSVGNRDAFLQAIVGGDDIHRTIDSTTQIRC